MTTIKVPPSKNYPNPLIAVPSIVLNNPKEGNKLINCEINWGTMGGDNLCVNLNLQNNATLEFSQIVAISIDNSQCAADVQFVFPDTGETTTFPGYAPKTIIEVFTNMTQFFVLSPGAEPEDVTRFSILNFLPPPISVPFTVEQQTATQNNIPAAVGGTQLLDAGVSGTLEGVNVFRTGPMDGDCNEFWTITDGVGGTFASGQFSSEKQSIFAQLINLNDMHLRFNDGLRFNVTGTVGGGAYCCTLLYRAP